MSSVFNCCNCSCLKSTSKPKISYGEKNYGSFDNFEISPDRIREIQSSISCSYEVTHWPYPISNPIRERVKVIMHQKMGDESSTDIQSVRDRSSLVFGFSVPSAFENFPEYLLKLSRNN